MTIALVCEDLKIRDKTDNGDCIGGTGVTNGGKNDVTANIDIYCGAS